MGPIPGKKDPNKPTVNSEEDYRCFNPAQVTNEYIQMCFHVLASQVGIQSPF